MRKVVFLSGPIDKPITGGEKYHQELAKCLLRRNLANRVLAQDDFPKTTKFLRVFLYNIVAIKKLWLYKNHIIVYPLRFSHCFFLYLLFAKIFRRNKIITIVHHIYSMHHYTDLINRRISWIFEKTAIKISDALIVNSKSTRNDTLSFDNNAKIVIVYPGTDMNTKGEVFKCKQQKQKTILLCVGTISRRKGYIHLIEALKILDNAYDIELNIVGDQYYERDYYDELRRYIAQESIENKINFLGRLKRQELNEKFRTSSIFVLPSLWEGYGIVLIEAMSYGLPIIATNTGAVPEIIVHKKNGILVPVGSAKALAASIEELIKNQRLAISMSKENLIRASSFYSWNEMANKFCDTLVQLNRYLDIGF